MVTTLNTHWYLPSTGVTIGFQQTEYTVAESSGAVTLTVALMEGSLQRNVTITFRTSRATATPTRELVCP